MAKRNTLVIFGGSAIDASGEICAAAEAIGRAAARAGWAIANGGYGGTMESSARGAHEAGGQAIGVTCSVFKSSPNPYIDEIIKTDNLFDRLRALIEIGDAYVVLPGSTGTLAELAVVWELVNKKMLPRRPILGWGDYWRPVVAIFDQDTTRDPRLNTAGLPDHRGELITFVHSAEEVFNILECGGSTPLS
jgi:uncharacterized protein (TIGR00730 family)